MQVLEYLQMENVSIVLLEPGDSRFFQEVGKFVRDNIASHPFNITAVKTLKPRMSTIPFDHNYILRRLVTVWKADYRTK